MAHVSVGRSSLSACLSQSRCHAPSIPSGFWLAGTGLPGARSATHVVAAGRCLSGTRCKLASVLSAPPVALPPPTLAVLPPRAAVGTAVPSEPRLPPQPAINIVVSTLSNIPSAMNLVWLSQACRASLPPRRRQELASTWDSQLDRACSSRAPHTRRVTISAIENQGPFRQTRLSRTPEIRRAISCRCKRQIESRSSTRTLDSDAGREVAACGPLSRRVHCTE